jgi:hypothetical protein
MARDFIEHLIERIKSLNYFYFTEDEFDPKRTMHNKPLFITMKCKNCMVAKVLIDNGSILNVLPKHMLDQMLIDASHIKPNTMTARAYDGTPRPIIRSIDVKLVIGPQPF